MCTVPKALKPSERFYYPKRGYNSPRYPSLTTVQYIGKLLSTSQGGGGFMFAARLITVLLLILAILIAYNPQFREQVMDTWEAVKPAVVQLMDGFYAAFRNVIVGDGSNDQMDHPPGDPGVNFDRIVTMSDTFSN